MVRVILTAIQPGSVQRTLSGSGTGKQRRDVRSRLSPAIREGLICVLLLEGMANDSIGENEIYNERISYQLGTEELLIQSMTLVCQGMIEEFKCCS